MDIKLKKACEGKSKSQGGLNVSDLKKLPGAKGSNRVELLNSLCKDKPKAKTPQLRCKEGQVLNPKTNRCIRINGPVYRKLVSEGVISQRPSNGRTTPRRPPARVRTSECKEGQVRNPKTNRCIKKNGPVYKKLVSEGVISQTPHPARLVTPQRPTRRASPELRESTQNVLDQTMTFSN